MINVKLSKNEEKQTKVAYNMDYLLCSGYSGGDSYTFTLLCAKTFRLALR